VGNSFRARAASNQCSMNTKNKLRLLLFSVLLSSSSLVAQTPTISCSQCAEWNAPQQPFRVFGNTYFVGPSGLSSILITSSKGHVLIDGALPESAEQIAQNIRTLGFRVEDVKLILNSHVHSDHAGGIAELQRLSGARVVASDWSAAVFTSAGVAKDDPQYGTIQPIPRVSKVERLRDGQTFRVGDIAITAHLTPGHTPGGTSWTWESCEGARCLHMVYADSLSPVSADGYKFSDHATTLAGFQQSFAFLRAAPCDILLTPHPDASSEWDDIKVWRLEGKPQPGFDGSACRKLADDASEQLHQRIAKENSNK
jgi:metallo-beta-lactamase class B